MNKVVLLSCIIVSRVTPCLCQKITSIVLVYIKIFLFLFCKIRCFRYIVVTYRCDYWPKKSLLHLSMDINPNLSGPLAVVASGTRSWSSFQSCKILHITHIHSLAQKSFKVVFSSVNPLYISQPDHWPSTIGIQTIQGKNCVYGESIINF